MVFLKKYENVFLLPLLLTLLPGLSFPVYIWLFTSWEINPFYSHGILIPIISVFLFWRVYAHNSLLITNSGATRGLIIFGFGLMLYCVGNFFSAWAISGISLIITLYGIIFQVTGPEFSKKCLFPVFFLVFMIPMPNIDVIATWLAAVSGCLAASLGNLLAIPAISNGAEISLPTASLVVGLPCSGMNTIIGLYIPASLLIYFLDCPVREKIAFWFLILPVAILSNIVRILLLLMVASWCGTNCMMSFFHTLYGILLPVVAFLFLVLIIIAGKCFHFRSDIW